MLYRRFTKTLLSKTLTLWMKKHIYQTNSQDQSVTILGFIKTHQSSKGNIKDQMYLIYGIMYIDVITIT